MAQRSNVVPFRNPRTPRIERRTPPKKLGYPSTLTLACDDGELSVDPARQVVQEVVPHNLPRVREPVVYVHEGVVLDLGDCATVRTMLRLSPDTAEAWGKALINAAKQAREEQGEAR